MKLTVFGATGRVGGHILRQAQAAGHEVTAAVRDPAALAAEFPDQRVVPIDFSSPDDSALVAALAGADAVLSALGPRSNRTAGIAEASTRALLPAMEREGVARILVISALPVPLPGQLNSASFHPGESWPERKIVNPLLQRAFLQIYNDLGRMEGLLRESSVEWTSVRPPRLTNKEMNAD
ncbi:MAG: NAD(P)-dependent oxidoreductase, partial [Angustibacter sp.]